jgi:hypothetical protein
VGFTYPPDPAVAKKRIQQKIKQRSFREKKTFNFNGKFPR